MSTSKQCSICKTVKNTTNFSKHNVNKDGVQGYCKKCNTKKTKEYFRTKIGLVTKIYNQQVQRSKRRKYLSPTYTKEELKSWLFSKTLFHNLFKEWVASNFHTDRVPSIDRKDDYIGYTMSNIQLMTWMENNLKGYGDRKSGINNKQNKGVLQYLKDGCFVRKYNSMMEAQRETGVAHQSIRISCKDNSKSAGGFKWCYTT